MAGTKGTMGEHATVPVLPTRRFRRKRTIAVLAVAALALAGASCSRHGSHGSGGGHGGSGGGWNTRPTDRDHGSGGDDDEADDHGDGDDHASGPGRAGGGVPTPPKPGNPGQPANPGGVAGDWWKPTPGTPWQIQLTTPVDLSIDAPVYDIDGEQNSKAVVDALHAKGRKVICYIDAGGAESYRADVASLPSSVLGKAVEGWPQERWLDVRQIETLRPVMEARMDMCRAKGFDAVDPDLLDAYATNSGFPITYADQLRYNRWLAQLAHERGMAVGLKGNVDQVKDLVNDFDFSVNEECAAYDECDTVAAFVQAGKAVFHIEYDLATTRFCGETESLGFSSLRKRLDLDAWTQAC
jgi:hypothetical protein